MTDDQGASAETPHAEYERLVRELAGLAESLLERVEPALRRAAAGVDLDEWAGCSWCPVCAALALLRGEHHDLVTTLADHGVTMVTMLREAIAGAPVDPVMPEGEPADPPRRVGLRRDPGPATGCHPATGGYQPIRITVK